MKNKIKEKEKKKETTHDIMMISSGQDRLPSCVDQLLSSLDRLLSGQDQIAGFHIRAR